MAGHGSRLTGLRLPQAGFVDQLHSSGVLDDSEHSSFAEIVEQLLRHLGRRGAVWRQPRLSEVCGL